jgi:Domain of unknown function (DUF4329)
MNYSALDCNSDQANCSGGAGFGWGGATSCSVDGLSAACSSVSALLNMGAALQCPSNVCGGVNSDGNFVRYLAFANGGSYYAYAGWGADYYSQNAAAIAFEHGYEGLSQIEGGEYNTTFYLDSNGIYSYSDPSFSACQPLPPTPFMGCSSVVDPTNIPDNTTPVGSGHTHPLEDALNQSDIIYGDDVRVANLLFHDYPTMNALYVGTTSGRVLLYVPSQFIPGQANQCQATSVLRGSASPAPCIPYR